MVAGPCDAAQQRLLDLRVSEITVCVSLHPDEGARWLAARSSVLVGLHLGNDLALMVARAWRRRDFIIS